MLPSPKQVVAIEAIFLVECRPNSFLNTHIQLAT
jgi:hypothetical protein